MEPFEQQPAQEQNINIEENRHTDETFTINTEVPEDRREYWQGFFIGLLLSFLVPIYFGGFIVGIPLLLNYRSKGKKKKADGLLIGLMIIPGILLLAVGACFLTIG